MRIAEQNVTRYCAGTYDLLYESADLVWPSRPGRMVICAARIRPPGRALDLGCGDGKNFVFLERSGWSVDGVEVSDLALQGLQRRLKAEKVVPRGKITLRNVVETPILKSYYDLVVCYGLYHCLKDSDLSKVHGKALEAVKPGGLFAFAVFNDRLPIPEGHCTGPLYLRAAECVFSMSAGWEIVSEEHGTITEAHPPLVSTHSHALTWGLLKRPLNYATNPD